MTARGRWTIGCAALVVVTIAGAGRGHAAYTEEKCQADRAKAAGKYADCAQEALADKLYSTDYDYEAYNVAAGKCVTKYAARWPKLQGKAAGTGTTCDNARFDTSVAGTVIDRLTGLQWEKKTSPGGGGSDPHDVDNIYDWTAGGADYTAADGTAFTSFLASLNSGGCFAGQCDWRLPTRDELLTIVTPAYPDCTSSPCIDPAFGPTAVHPYSSYWSATTAATSPHDAWRVTFINGLMGVYLKYYYAPHVRAVRAGL